MKHTTEYLLHKRFSFLEKKERTKTVIDDHRTWMLIFEYLRKRKRFGPNIVYSVPVCMLK